MKVVTWNSRGVKNGPFRRECKELIKMQRPDIICFLETKADSSTTALNFMRRFGFDRDHQVFSQGMAGGIWLFWRSSTVCLDVLHSSSQLIHCIVSQQQVTCLLTFVYVQPHVTQKDIFWCQLREIASQITENWIVMGDFNDILSIDEASPCAIRSFAHTQRFRDRVSSCGLHSTDSLGCKFTWVRKQHGRVLLRERLDRALFNLLALESFADAKVINLPRICSDHHPVLLCLDSPPLLCKASKPLRFEAAWLTHDDFGQVFTNAWVAHGSSIVNAINSVQKKCLQWNKEVFGDLFRRKRHLKGRLAGIQNSIHYPSSRFLQNLEYELLIEYHRVLHSEELFWCQKSRVEWIASGDRNTSFYHATTVIQRSRNRISVLKIDESWVQDPSILQQHIRDFFVEVFSRKPTQSSHLDYSAFQPRLSDEESVALLLPVSLDEVRSALFSMKALKSPGPDGIQPIFYQKHWEVVSDTLLTFINRSLLDGYFELSLLRAYIVLIPKGENADVIQKFRPICLLNVAYKVLAKVIVNRLRPLLQHLIGPFQSSFLPGRSTADNILLTQEAVHSMCRSRGKKGALAFKIDLHKAFDSVDWDFLHLVLEDFNLPTPLIRLIMFSVSSLQLSVLWNGEELPPFQPQRGLRQGDPLSPYLFIMVMEKLSHKIQSRVQSPIWRPFKISRGGLELSHLFFADDLMLFCTATQNQVEVVMDCIREFSMESGLDINLAKSKLYVSQNIQRHIATSLSNACGIPLTSDMGMYLGVRILHGRQTKDTYKHLLEKIQVKLSSWKQKMLSIAGRRILVQTVTSAIPTYTMQSILLPDYVCAAIDRLNRNFLWGSDVANRPHLVNWHSVCLPRTQGGLGIRSAKDNNRALIAKLGWQLLSNPEKPWCRAFIQKYLQRGSFMSCNINSTSSVTWKSILRCRDVLRLGLRWRVGSGEKIKFWQDAWVSDRPLLDAALIPVLEDQIDIPVSHVINPDRTWDFQVLQQLLPELVVEQISALPLPSFGHQEDGICEQDQETPLHLLRDCYYSRLVWESTPLPANFFNLDLDGWLYQNATSTSSIGESRQLWSMLFLALLWYIWKSRNALIFEDKRLPPQIVLQQATSLAMNTRLALATQISSCPRVSRWVRWYPPDLPFFKLNTDGAMNHATTKASAGGLIRDHEGRWVHGFSLSIGHQSSFMAELSGCREGLRMASDLGITHLILEMDSLLVVHMLQAKEGVEGLAWTLFSDILHLLRTFSEYHVQHTFREGNFAADYMAAIGQNLSHGVTMFPEPPVGIASILNRDAVGTLFPRS
ncbi:hypothetical protein SLEP1_g20594 [Rubroshorea leprosula]|nr:hypothetical protein SLEP1_g20594 [Rubroshorea leprosula]